MKLIPKVRRFHERDIVRVVLDSGEILPFYRSTGKNSGMAGEWLPFDGISLYPRSWFDKARFTEHEGALKGQPLHRYGTHEIKAASESLGKLDIPKGHESKPQAINRWLATQRSMEWYRANKAFEK